MLKVIFEPINNTDIYNSNNILKKKTIFEEEPIIGIKAEKKEKIIKEYSLSNQINNLTKLILLNSKILIELKKHGMDGMDSMDGSIFDDLNNQYEVVKKQFKTINSIIGITEDKDHI